MWSLCSTDAGSAAWPNLSTSGARSGGDAPRWQMCGGRGGGSRTTAAAWRRSKTPSRRNALRAMPHAAVGPAAGSVRLARAPAAGGPGPYPRPGELVSGKAPIGRSPAVQSRCFLAAAVTGLRRRASRMRSPMVRTATLQSALRSLEAVWLFDTTSHDQSGR